MTLPRAFLDRPLAHRGLHGPGRPENSAAAIRAAFTHGYGCEIDVQPSADGIAMVFHDATLDRLTDMSGPIRARSAEDLAAVDIGGSGERIPRLADILSLATGPLLIELKDQSGGMVGTDGTLETGVAAALANHAGPVAVMSFNPDMVAKCADLMPDIPRGLTTSPWVPGTHDLPEITAGRLRAITDLARAGATFISHAAFDLAAPRVAELKAAGVPVLCWTIRSPAAEAQARNIADNVTFEGYRPA